MKTLGPLACIAATSLLLASCSQPPSTNYLERQLIPRTGPIMPRVKGTQFDCSIASAQHGAANLWQANVGGRVLSDNQPYNVSTEACFTTQSDCEAFLYLMNGVLDQIITSRCQMGYEKSFFDKLFGS
ncbi:hypothetical protein [Pseudovibrio axinellae]|nr:hypothetical protein [Pseudovibrio axinellae]